MANQQIFCNTPWYEAHIYWDGSLGICCQESRKLYSNQSQYNIKTMTLAEWFNSLPVRQFRQSLLSNQPTDICSWCQHDEAMGGTSRRHRANQKSVIFTKTAFDNSYEQSPGYKHFKLSEEQNGLTDTLPIDLHVDLGNYCNLACKMCYPIASTTIAVQHVRWGIESDRQYLGLDWTKDEQAWQRFLNELLTIPKLKNIHFMGGETLLTKRFEEFVDFFILHERYDISFSFVTNGTQYNQQLLDKLKKFARVGIEVSIETNSPHNSYVRQGTDTDLVLANIQQYQDNCDNTNISVTLRPAISALTVGNYYTLLDYCLEHKLLIKSLLVTIPKFLNVDVLPLTIRQSYIPAYKKLLDKVNQFDVAVDFNESDPNNFAGSIKTQILQIINVLSQPDAEQQELLLQDMIWHCKKWDQVYGFDAVELYPELAEVFTKYGY